MSKSIVLIPTYNEEENIGLMIDKINSLNKGYDILIIDDNSKDSTASIVRDKMQSKNNVFIKNRFKKKGLGPSYVDGFKWAIEKKYDYIFQMDGDFSHNPNDLEKLIDSCKRDNLDFCIGSRYKNGISVINWPISRIFISYMASKYVNFITGMPIKDPTSGFGCYKRVVLEKIMASHKSNFKGYIFQIDIKFRAWSKGFKLGEIPIIFKNRTLGRSKMNYKILWEAIIGVFLIKLKQILHVSTYKKC